MSYSVVALLLTLVAESIASEQNKGDIIHFNEIFLKDFKFFLSPLALDVYLLEML